MRLISKLILIYFIIELAIFIGVSSIPYNNPALVQEYNSMESGIYSMPYFSQVIEIFSHNLLIATIDFIPVVGAIFFGISIGQTAYLLSVVATSRNVPSFLVAIALLTLPHSAVELPTYAIAVAAGTYVIVKRKDWKRYLLMYPLIPIELFLAALIESAIITYTGFNPYALWPASIGSLLLVYFLYQRIQKFAESLIKTQNMQPVLAGTSALGSVPIYASYYNNFKNVMSQAIQYEVRSDFINAVNNYWLAVIFLIDAIATKMNMPYYTKQDLDNVISYLSQREPGLFDDYNRAFQYKLSNDIPQFLQTVKILIPRLDRIYVSLQNF
ncbi:stage II sporulation protein M [Sulfolobus acidocaldarius]|uniref:Conserved Archaeal protein n=4 Tax=Sulfolobus acidocaldarius TaxID=2285 RepID=Q4JCC8_SULAC|nr:stage II sporulation protein M [Sulfolobus acidocaldarius]AAY79551.1 conserved Archaeal protein [Sulfolobus acidocaldarius DSM 639]AGE70102.1 hypothetical protein SacN8_00605 [Sulfolobus acidocaldarius N8]AGE72377.1 hypothetical protein SacRon12I_00605 [Sulfolobus acidocaldarius Ron12/I]ALU29480.1 hypothetical protein ATY89_05640 [Sulfolobus acidocaldarius]ALU32208.1 hypothetical protein ATZ20_08665 [Sulfolobus acidocaldarius]